MSPFVRNTNLKFTRAPSHSIHEDGRPLTPRTATPDYANNEHNKRGLQGGGDVESDATLKREGRDAPGQNCLHITSGMHNEEHYRLATFSKYPNNVPAKVADMAAAGFYYSGFKDRVKCYSCGISVENWTIGDDGMDKKWHKSDCRLVAGADAYNKPLPTPNFRTLFREYRGLTDFTQTGNSNFGQNNSQAATTSLPVRTANNAISRTNESTPMENVTSNMANFQLSEMNYQPLQLANVTTPEHKSLLLRLNLQKEEDRRSSFAKWPSYPAPNLPGELARHGFFYLGNIDRTQCFSCSGVLLNWAAGDNVHEQHRTHLSECRIVKNLGSGNIPMTDSQRRVADEADRVRIDALRSAGSNGEPSDPSIEEQQQLVVQFPCSRPTNPHMESLEARIASFDSRWPGLVLASKEHLARAGFYFLGQSDKAKCFYCNGGLQNWDPEDEPWTEHAKWFPGCEYVIRRKGVDFVRNLKEAHPNLSRPYIRNSVSYDIPPTAGVQRSPVSHANENTTSSRININQIMSMGFSREQINNAIQRKRGEYNTTEELLNDLLEQNVETPSLPHEPSSIAEGTVQFQPIAANAGIKRGVGTKGATTDIKKTRTSFPAESFSTEGSEMAESLRAMEEESRCKTCKINKASIVFTPCGHLCVCEGCSKRTRRCPICKAKVHSIVKVFRA